MTLPPRWRAYASQKLESVRQASRWRSLRSVESAPGPAVRIGGRELAMFCSNDYLSLAGSDYMRAALTRAVAQWGAGSSGSPLISGYSAAHAALCERLAQWKGTERALLFNSGWQCNTGVFAALGTADDPVVVFSDALNHASLIDGLRGATSERHIYRHADMEHLAQLLQQHAAGRRSLIVTESIFSMDGDAAPLGAICDLADQYGALVYVDEAHASGLYGPQGAGLVSELGLQGRVAMQMGTLGKALGLAGAYIAVPQMLHELLVNSQRSLIFSTAMPPAWAQAAVSAIDYAQQHAGDVRLYRERCAALAVRLRAQRLRVPATDSPIIPVVVGPEQATMDLCSWLLDRGFYVQGIRPPTVAPGTSRLRLTVQLGHSPEQIAALEAALVEGYRTVALA